MKLSEVKAHLNSASSVNFILPDGKKVPEHLHVTEVGVITKHFIDCGGTIRNEKVANFQLWNANDFDHQLKPQKLMNIISLSEKKLGMEDLEIEVEYQGETIGKYGLDLQDENFILTTKSTDCLAKDNCGNPPEKIKVKLGEMAINESICCIPGNGCC
jgi:Family of unknown function (DUF6428)